MKMYIKLFLSTRLITRIHWIAALYKYFSRTLIYYYTLSLCEVQCILVSHCPNLILTLYYEYKLYHNNLICMRTYNNIIGTAFKPLLGDD